MAKADEMNVNFFESQAEKMKNPAPDSMGQRIVTKPSKTAEQRMLESAPPAWRENIARKLDAAVAAKQRQDSDSAKARETERERV